MVKDIAFTAYPAKDVPALREFYTSVLGLNFSGPFEEEGVLKYDEAKVGNSWFAVLTTDWADVHPSGGVSFEVDDIDNMLETLKGRGIKVEEVYDTPVCRISGFSDPEGNRVTLHQTTVPH